MSEHSQYTKIWRTVQLIPLGKVASYGQIADLAGLQRRARLVGKSLRFVPENMNLPWYRVLRSNGQIAFLLGSEQSQIQTHLLRDEGVIVYNNRVKLSLFQWQPNLPEILWKLEY